MEKIRKCPKCRKKYNTYPAISREDNKTEICPTCGQKEAMGQWVKFKMIEKWKKDYTPGTRIELIHMGEDIDAIENGTKGIVEHVDDIGTIHCKFDNGRYLGLIPGVDFFRIVKGEEND